MGEGAGYLSAFPNTKEELQGYDVIFLGDVGVGNGQLSNEQAALIKGLVEQQASGLVFLPGPLGRQKTLLDSPLGDLVPVETDYCLLYTSDAADERSSVDLGGRRIIKKKK